MNDIHQWPVRVYYEDTDTGGVVYHANYLAYMERARTEWLRDLGVEQDSLMQGDKGILFAVRSINISFIKPALFNESLVVETQIERLGRASIVFKQQVKRYSNSNHHAQKNEKSEQQDEAELLIEASVKVASINAFGKLKKAMVIPEDLYHLFTAYTNIKK